MRCLGADAAYLAEKLLGAEVNNVTILLPDRGARSCGITDVLERYQAQSLCLQFATIKVLDFSSALYKHD